MTSRMESRFLADVCDEVSLAWIDDDAHVLRNLLRTLQAHAPRALWAPNPQIDPAQALAWWRRRGNLPPHLRWIQPVLQMGEQPVFASVSLCVPGSATPTIYLPVPYSIHSYQGLRELFWPGPLPEESRDDLAKDFANERAARLQQEMEHTAWEPLARTLSHALANVSHTMRVGDRPTYGWLAYAHASSKVLYLPDLARVAEDAEALEDRYDLRNAAVSEEDHVGMASALYVPLWNEHLVKVHVEGSVYAQAVLLLWSPVPNRWDHVFECASDTAVHVVEEDDWDVRRKLSHELSWIRGVISKETRSQKTTEAQVLALLHGLAVSTFDRSGDAPRAVGGIIHGLGDILAPLRSATVPSPSRLLDWLDFQFCHTNGVRNILETNGRRDLGDVPVVFLHRGRELMRMGLGEWCEGRASLDWGEVDLALAWKVAVRLGADPADNIDKFGKTLKKIEVDRSERYVTIRYCLDPKPQAKNKIYGNPGAFKRYYAVRRGLPVTPGSVESDRSGYGLGLLLHRVVAGRYRVYRFLYLSADGSECRVEQALPILQHLEGENAQDPAVRGRRGRRHRARRRIAARSPGARVRE